MDNYGLIGKNIAYSFSKKYFSEKFEMENISASYENFDLQNIEGFPEIILKNKQLKGLNVTIPFKEKIIPFLDSLSSDAEEIGAVNTIKIETEGSLTGHNTDHSGFEKVLGTLLPLKKNTALILGSGGASKAIQFVLKKKGFDFKTVSRNENSGDLTYQNLSKKIIEAHFLIINCTPLGTFPNIEACPEIPYKYLNSNHFLLDLIYNPLETNFLKLGKEKGARTNNGLEMLKNQAEKSWEIWNS